MHIDILTPKNAVSDPLLSALGFQYLFLSNSLFELPCNFKVKVEKNRVIEFNACLHLHLYDAISGKNMTTHTYIIQSSHRIDD